MIIKLTITMVIKIYKIENTHQKLHTQNQNTDHKFPSQYRKNPLNETHLLLPKPFPRKKSITFSHSVHTAMTHCKSSGRETPKRGRRLRGPQKGARGGLSPWGCRQRRCQIIYTYYCSREIYWGHFSWGV